MTSTAVLGLRGDEVEDVDDDVSGCSPGNFEQADPEQITVRKEPVGNLYLRFIISVADPDPLSLSRYIPIGTYCTKYLYRIK